MLFTRQCLLVAAFSSASPRGVYVYGFDLTDRTPVAGGFRTGQPFTIRRARNFQFRNCDSIVRSCETRPVQAVRGAWSGSGCGCRIATKLLPTLRNIRLPFLFNPSPTLLRHMLSRSDPQAARPIEHCMPPSTLPIQQISKSRLASWLRFSLECPKRRLEPLVHNRIYDRFRGRQRKGRLRRRGSERPRRIGGRVRRR